MKSICIIPARGGSKRIPRKNIKDFLGKPIIAYSIETALESGLFDEVMVSTDDDEIAEIARKYGAVVPFYRSEKNANDHAGTTAVLLEVLNDYFIKFGKEFKYGCCIYPAAPLITTQSIFNGFEKLKESGLDSVFPVVVFSYPVQRALKISNGRLKFYFKEYANTRTQDLEELYHDAGQWYWFDCRSLIEKKSLLTENTSYIILEESRAQDIDNESDWAKAILKYKAVNGG